MKKNVVLISFDDAVAFWKYKTLFGARLQTPNLDRIMAVSTTFQAAYCQSPLCGPSRASFMSGRSPYETGILGNDVKAFTILKPQDIWTWQLRAGGYYCSSGGKVHHGYRPLPPEVHEVLYSDERKFFPVDLQVRPGTEISAVGGAGGGVSTLNPEDDDKYHDAHSARSFASFIETYDGHAPFYREVGFFSPHTPFITPLRFKTMYNLQDFRYPDEWADEIRPDGKAYEQVSANFRTHEARHWKKSVRSYFAAISHGDHYLGKVWDALQNSRHAGNTILVILTDHGMHLGEKRRFGKSTLLEQVANVPLIIHDPENPQPRDIDAPVGLIDVGPTVLDMLGMAPPPHSLGTSLVPLMRGDDSLADRAIPTLNHEGVTIRKGRYRFTRRLNGRAELHDLSQDWWQMHDLGPDHPEFAALSAEHLSVSATYGVRPDAFGVSA